MALKVIPEQPYFPTPKAASFTDVRTWMGSLNAVLARLIRDIASRSNASITKDGQTAMTAPMPLVSYTVAGVPTASDWTGAVIYVSDEAGGAIPAFSDGTNWRRVTDRAIVS